MLTSRSNHGFTLIEMLVVVTIIGILVAIAAISSGIARSRARDVRRKEDLRMLQTGIETYYQATRTFPSMAASWKATDALPNVLIPNYMTAVPKDPRGVPNWTYYGYQAAALTTGTALTNVVIPATGASRYRIIAALELEDSAQPTAKCTDFDDPAQKPPQCVPNDLYTFAQTGGALWHDSWKTKSF